MKPAPRYLKIAGIVAMLTVPAILLLILSSGSHKFFKLPIYGPKDAVSTGDTLYHTIPSFSFINQDGEAFGSNDLENKIYVVNFIFTTCPSICPLMTGQMYWLDKKLDNSAFKNVQFLSISVNPEHDTPQVLSTYALEKDLDLTRWNLLTGDKRAIYKLGADGFFLASREDVMAPGGFLHSEKVVLVDWKKQIRGFYDGTDANEMNRLKDEIKVLMKQRKVEMKENESK